MVYITSVCTDWRHHIPGCWLCAGDLGGEPTTSSICWVRLPRCHWDKNYTWQKELRSHWSNNLEQSSGRSAPPLTVTAVIWTKTETIFVWAMSAPEEFCLSRAIQMFALLLLLHSTVAASFWKWESSSRAERSKIFWLPPSLKFTSVGLFTFMDPLTCMGPFRFRVALFTFTTVSK